MINIIRNQIFINDKQFELSMIEHHEMAIVMANKIKQKTLDPQLLQLANNIIQSQQQEINFMWQKYHEKNNYSLLGKFNPM